MAVTITTYTTRAARKDGLVFPPVRWELLNYGTGAELTRDGEPWASINWRHEPDGLVKALRYDPRVRPRASRIAKALLAS